MHAVRGFFRWRLASLKGTLNQTVFREVPARLETCIKGSCMKTYNTYHYLS